MSVICLDLEGVLVPEIWINVAAATGIEKLKLTTRDISDYDVLMKGRIGILKENKLTLADIQNVIARMGPLKGALAFLDRLRGLSQVIILSDTFVEFATPLMKMLGWPTIFCNHLITENGMITGYALRQNDGKKHAVEALRGIGFRVVASGDSYNDVSMLAAAHAGVFFRPPATIAAEYPQFPITENYDELYAAIEKGLEIHP
ncbi:MAG: bifunctional phosphoserine phosphatase/homoserine phosphotransferase ThrH [Spirochaetota bacterium]